MRSEILSLYNGQSRPLSDLPILSHDIFMETLADLLEAGHRASAYFASGRHGDNQFIYAILAHDSRGLISAMRCKVQGGSFQSLTNRFPQLHLFEREIHEQSGLIPQGHPWLKPVRFPNATESRTIGDIDFFRVDGHEIHEVAVGPVHAGIIEPGHFRFQCHGETVFHLEISLGYQHRGIEKTLIGGPHTNSLCQMELVAGDTSVGHAVAYCRVLEALNGCSVSPHATTLRAVGLELERCANHTGDLGALAGDVGYLPTMAYCGRIRGDFLNLTALLCGNRFGRRLVVPGGVGYDLDEKRHAELMKRVETTLADFNSATELLWEEPSVLARFENTGIVTLETAQAIGLVGPAARASGCLRDVRQDHASGWFCFSHIPVVIWDTGDVFGRAYVRWREVQESVKYILENLQTLRPDDIKPAQCSPLKPNALAVTLSEGWRGEICHVAVTDSAGKFSTYKIVDPSFHNWFGLALALRGQQISDFPLCNKSFNLSYCGFDL